MWKSLSVGRTKRTSRTWRITRARRLERPTSGGGSVPRSKIPLYDGFCQIGSAGQSLKLTIRKPFAHELGLRVGDTVMCRIVDGALIVRPVKQLIEDVSRAFELRDEDAVRAARL